MTKAQGSSLCSTLVDKKDDHVCSMLVHIVCCNLIRFFFAATIGGIFAERCNGTLDNDASPGNNGPRLVDAAVDNDGNDNNGGSGGGGEDNKDSGSDTPTTIN